MGSYGSGPYGYRAAADALPVEAAELPVVNASSRRLDGKTKLVSFDDDGNAEAMDDVAQRVLLLVSYQLQMPPVVGRDFGPLLEQRIRKALAPLLARPAPAIQLHTVAVTRDASTTYVEVRYRNLLTNADQRQRFAR